MVYDLIRSDRLADEHLWLDHAIRERSTRTDTMNSPHLQVTRVIPVSGAGRAILACGLLALSNLSAFAQAREAASVRLDFLPGGYHVPFFLALERGYYRDNGIDLQINDGKGSGPTIQVVGSNLDTFGLAGLSAVALAISKDIPLISVGGLVQKDSNAIFFIAGKGLEKPKGYGGKQGALLDTGAM